MSNLAINGGHPVRDKSNPFPSQLTIGEEERSVVNRVLDSKKLSDFRGNWIPQFWGGTEVRNLEIDFSKKFHALHALAVNSCTSALQIACMAIGLEPGDEVIVTPWSMSCSATAPLICGAIPIFADINEQTFNLDPDDVERKITNRTKAIIVVDLFGQPFDKRINEIADKHHLIIIEDAAQAIGSMRDGKYAGTLGDIGCFSFTQGKHLTCGEGGMITTNDTRLFQRCAMIRNHAESVYSAMPEDVREMYGGVELLGFNLRMTEIHAAIIREQLKKLDGFIAMRQENAREIYNSLIDIPPLAHPLSMPDKITHSYYVQPFYFHAIIKEGQHSRRNPEVYNRDAFIKAVVAELAGEKGRADKPMLGCGYIKPLYLMPIFQERRHWALKQDQGKTALSVKGNYQQGSCPVCERLWKDEFFLSMYHNLPLEEKDFQDIQTAFHKVWNNREELK